MGASCHKEACETCLEKPHRTSLGGEATKFTGKRFSSLLIVYGAFGCGSACIAFSSQPMQAWCGPMRVTWRGTGYRP